MRLANFPAALLSAKAGPSEKEILTSRLIDRPIRPLFPEGFPDETQVIAMVLSADPERDPGTLAIVGAGAALAISDIPFHHCSAPFASAWSTANWSRTPRYEEAKKPS